jgi:hypothetical protein
MWNWFNCYLSGRHDFGVWCQPGAIYLRCVHCGKRSSGWTVDAKLDAPPAKPLAQTPRTLVAVPSASASTSRVLPFTRIAAR